LTLQPCFWRESRPHCRGERESEFLKLLQAAGLDINYTRLFLGMTTLHYAYQCELARGSDIVQYLLQSESDTADMNAATKLEQGPPLVRSERRERRYVIGASLGLATAGSWTAESPQADNLACSRVLLSTISPADAGFSWCRYPRAE
jgi:hypothetical protein